MSIESSWRLNFELISFEVFRNHLVALGGEKGQTFILSLEQSFIYQSKPLDGAFETTWWRYVAKKVKILFWS